MSKKNIIVTGGSGFVGANLVRMLLNHHYNVHVFIRTNRSLFRLADVLPQLTVYTNVLSDTEILKRTIQQIKPYAICHLATYGAYPHQHDISSLLDSNIRDTLHLLEVVREVGVEKFIAAGSSSEYGKKAVSMRESQILEPNNLYAAAKAMQTHVLQVYAKQYQVPAMILRLFNVYGPFEEEGRLVRNVIEKALKNEDILLASGGEARDFIYIDDISSAFLSCIEGRVFPGEIFNIGTGKQSTIYQLAELVKKLTHSSSAIILNAYEGRVWDTTRWQANMKKTYIHLHWKPKYTLTRGLKKTIEWYKLTS